MKTYFLDLRIVLALIFTCAALVVICGALGQTKSTKLMPLVVDLNMKSMEYQEVLGGPPRTVSMESGLVVLAPSKSGKQHSTKKYEEVLVVFDGTGEMRIVGGETLNLKPNVIAYCPAMTEHQIANTGSTPLRYLYVAAKSLP
jgi:mannose-6-phosphate isomerase-like protein (cupin superfamily)